METKLKFLGFAGSLRVGSYNKALLRAATNLLPQNAIDFASRPYGDNPFDGKPVAIMSASIGMLGGARAQYHLRQVFVFLNMHPINGPEVIVPFAQDRFDAKGNLLDNDTKKFLGQLLQNLADWTRKLRVNATQQKLSVS